MRRLVLVSVPSLALVGCDIFGDDPIAGDAAFAITDTGTVLKLVSGDDAVDAPWTATVASGSEAVAQTSGDDLIVAVGSTIHAVAGTDGAVLWTWDAPSTVTALAGPVGGVVAVLTLDSLHGLGEGDGGEVWTHDLLDLPGVSDHALGAAGEHFVLGGAPARVLNAGTGDVAAAADLGVGTVQELAVSGSRAVFGGTTGLVAATVPGLSAEWTLPTDDEVDRLTVGGSFYYALLGGGVGGVDSDGTLLFETAVGDLFTALAAGGGLLVGARTDGTVFAWDGTTGAESWPISAPEPVTGLAIGGSTLFFLHGDVIDVANLADGADIGQHTADGTPVAIAAP